MAQDAYRFIKENAAVLFLDLQQRMVVMERTTRDE